MNKFAIILYAEISVFILYLCICLMHSKYRYLIAKVLRNIAVNSVGCTTVSADSLIQPILKGLLNYFFFRLHVQSSVFSIIRKYFT